MSSAHERVESCATVFTLPEICGCVRKVAGDSDSTMDDLANVLRRSRRSTTSPARLAGTLRICKIGVRWPTRRHGGVAFQAILVREAMSGFSILLLNVPNMRDAADSQAIDTILLAWNVLHR